ncbi:MULTISPECIES: glucuronate isomerase [unclassified Enterococcus]|uniref:glucuronate isomerase n=1 Tax=unclassified Enterococcus TaxID=2608891 RepID=UPI001554B57E|nr:MULTISPECIES: glucuronate isomerase [unclassified Enterococcus]MBS7578150.1 glucuronate isomerase [Enterococcus sp. MMGLQ5-2]MBS7584034.1 glucuronate isomerase [Enterococcus sp. MMGLQ5-1]NPD11895.1 glucuronate isomerase [Enterococcus sp. MMGLQ5-1]NPD37981.1 glucuronate isomerase [Enterococcus sp. MMGLQ5-2]
MFLNDNFVLKNQIAQKLYHEYASKMPIYDYHCHLNPKEIYENQNFENITQAWLSGDHYKWRLMRANGVPERLITGDGDDYEKFLAWASTIEQCIGNPLYVWTNLELRRIFEIDELLTRENAPLIWEKANARLKLPEMRVQNLIKRFKVKVICTTDDPIDSLAYHKKLQDNAAFKVLPTFRADQLIHIEAASFTSYLEKLTQTTQQTIGSYQDFILAIKARITYFAQLGCRLSDQSLSTLSINNRPDANRMATIFSKRLNRKQLSPAEINEFQFGMLVELMKCYAKENWVAQMHLMVSRNNNRKLFEASGADSGGDAMLDNQIQAGLGQLFDLLNTENQLPKTILYSLNPNDYIPIVSLMGCFQADVKGKIQFGSAWWFNDTYSGMRHQLTTIAEGSILANFVGMLTDSRSFLSYPRHEYFRRILCQLISEWVEDGQLTDDLDFLGQIVAQISYKNAKSYFNIEC